MEHSIWITWRIPHPQVSGEMMHGSLANWAISRERHPTTTTTHPGSILPLSTYMYNSPGFLRITPKMEMESGANTQKWKSSLIWTNQCIAHQKGILSTPIELVCTNFIIFCIKFVAFVLLWPACNSRCFVKCSVMLSRPFSLWVIVATNCESVSCVTYELESKHNLRHGKPFS